MREGQFLIIMSLTSTYQRLSFTILLSVYHNNPKWNEDFRKYYEFKWKMRYPDWAYKIKTMMNTHIFMILGVRHLVVEYLPN